MTFRRFPVALLLIGLLAIGSSEAAEATPAEMAAAKAAAAERALVAEKAAPETLYESNYVADPTPEAQLDGMDNVLDMLVQIQPSSETIKAVEAANAAMHADNKVSAKATPSKAAMVEEKFVEPAAVSGIYSTSVGPTAEEQEGAMDSVFDMLVQLPEEPKDATSKLKRALKKKEQEVRALKAKIAAKAKSSHHEAKKAPRHEEHREHNEDHSVDELDEDGDMDTDEVEEEQEDEEEEADNKPRERPTEEVEDWSPPALRSVDSPRTQRKATAVAAKSPVIVDSGLSKDPEAAAALAAVNSGVQAPAGASISGETSVKSTDYGGETTPNMGNILKPNMHVLKPAEVRQAENKDEANVEAAALKKEYYKMVDLNNPGAAAARKARQSKGLAAFKRIAGLQSNGQTQVWLLGCSGNAACEDSYDDAS